ncbi:MAG: leucyl/phenylalanyl-tRNA--protein transferase, partial [Flavobacteriaceae bacterium]|nr:leucyl/phenylalanyl-tRNA--protein transferase [Flavobacteriaceae bacterium]
MTVRWLNDTMGFPSLDKANKDGLLAFGGGLTNERVLLAYENGIFPWYEAGQPIMWWSPDPRFVLYPHKLK